jgi:hypothetical protein
MNPWQARQLAAYRRTEDLTAGALRRAVRSARSRTGSRRSSSEHDGTSLVPTSN